MKIDLITGIEETNQATGRKMQDAWGIIFINGFPIVSRLWIQTN